MLLQKSTYKSYRLSVFSVGEGANPEALEAEREQAEQRRRQSLFGGRAERALKAILEEEKSGEVIRTSAVGSLWISLLLLLCPLGEDIRL